MKQHPKKDRRIAEESGKVLRFAREMKRLTQAQAAERAGIARTSLVKIEDGTHAPGLDTFIHICRVYGLDPGFAMSRIEKELRK